MGDMTETSEMKLFDSLEVALARGPGFASI